MSNLWDNKNRLFVADLAIEESVVKISHFYWSQATCQEKDSLIPNRNLNSKRFFPCSHCLIPWAPCQSQNNTANLWSLILQFAKFFYEWASLWILIFDGSWKLKGLQRKFILSVFIFVQINLFNRSYWTKTPFQLNKSN